MKVGYHLPIASYDHLLAFYKTFTLLVFSILLNILYVLLVCFSAIEDVVALALGDHRKPMINGDGTTVVANLRTAKGHTQGHHWSILCFVGLLLISLYFVVMRILGDSIEVRKMPLMSPKKRSDEKK